ncbi:MAG: histone deacetylase [archaeon]
MHNQTVKATYNPACRMENYRFPYSSSRVDNPKKALEESGIEIIDAPPASENDLLLAHNPEYVTKIKNTDFSSFDRIRAFLEGVPTSEDIYQIALASAGCATKALEIVEGNGGMCFALTQPPGHHAGKSSYGGFCIFNNAAIVAKKAVQDGYKRVSIIDIDVHHCNGTEEIIQGDKNIMLASIHLKPFYPLLTGWRSKENCENYSVLSIPGFRSATKEDYLKILDDSLEHVKNYNPELLIVSAGFDTYKKDPIGKMALEEDSYAAIGKRIETLDLPTVAVLEGGYAQEKDKLPRFVTDFSKAFI